MFDVTTTYYNNTWEDKAFTRYSAPDIYNISGLSANHSGIEIEADVRPMDLLSLDAAFSFGNWAWGEDVVAFVVGTAGKEELDSYCLENLARFKRPKKYVFLESLPKNNYGKILKKTLRYQLSKGEFF